MSESYVQLVTREFKRMQLLAQNAIAQLSEDHFFAVPSPGDNSVAVIVKHMSGNLISRWTNFLTSDGEKPGRNRDMEFQIGANDTREELLKMWTQGWTALFDALASVSDSDLAQIITIRGEPLTVLQAVNRQLTHYAYHVGQIVYVAKHHSGSAWRFLSIPPSGSVDFNRKPAQYVPTPERQC